MESLKKSLSELETDFNKASQKLDLDKSVDELEKLRSQMQRPDFWRDQQKAQAVSKRESALAKRIGPWLELRKAIDEAKELIKLNDATLEKEIAEQLDKTSRYFAQLKKDLRFRGPYDDRPVILSVYAGAGGTDAQDWAQMLLRMYARWADKNGLELKTIDQTPGEEAGIKSATVGLDGGSFLYGKLAGERGVHRLVRLSPFNADHLRQTSFAKVEVIPLIDKPQDAEIDEKDLKIDVFRSSGAGGQSVNTTDSAVRLTHLPTGLSVSVQNERSQLQNKQTAMAILGSKLVQLKLEQHQDHISQLKGPNQSAEWGNQIRSYVLHPYKQVKDLRTGYETSDPQKVLDGELEPLIEAWLEYLSTSR